MQNALASINGFTVPIEAVIEALERSPSKAEVLTALKDLRRAKVRDALGQTVKAARFNRGKVVEDFLIDGARSERTRLAYRMMLAKLFDYADGQGIPILQLARSDANRYRDFLATHLAPNSVRLALAAAGAFFKYLEVTRTLETNPFAALALPRRVFKHAIEPDRGKPIPVMDSSECQEIMMELERMTLNEGKDAGKVKSSARSMIPLARVLAETGARLGDAISMKREASGKVSMRVKGGKVRTMAIPSGLAEVLEKMNVRPFANTKAKTFRAAFRRLTVRLAAEGRIRCPYSPHDFRHFFAVSLYQKTRDVLAVQKALGHASLAVTQVYLASLGAVEET